jgi:alpha-tubulin suppressor-like RCC1 family protein
MSAGGEYTLAIKTNGTLWGWGYNTGQLGNGTSVEQHTPIQIGTDTNWQSVEAGYFHVAAIKTNGTLWTWGANTNGQLGDGTLVRKYVPTQIGTATNWLSVSAGYSFTYATQTDYSLWSWGINDNGELSNGTSGATNTVVPTRVGLTSDTYSVSAGFYHVLEKNSDGFMRACGQNTSGQIGIGTNAQQNTLATIACPAMATENFGIATELKMYPNPIQDVLNLSYDHEITSVSMYNLYGQVVLTQDIKATEGSVNTSALASGTYIVKVTSNLEVKTLKVIKE